MQRTGLATCDHGRIAPAGGPQNLIYSPIPATSLLAVDEIGG